MRISKADVARAQKYQDAVREVTLQLRREQERRERFTASVLTQPETARNWWLERHLDDLGAIDWDTFREKVLPLVGAADDAQSKAEYISRTIQHVLERLEDDPAEHARFATTVRTVLEQMGWGDAAPVLTAGETPLADGPTRHGGDEGKRRQAAETGAAA
ncbi:hypothetical protein [Streptomyces armeniacus]|uniref:hypothetical protein n=1 Tax=Streptomyces armeniacus TaxID=83291 RepID=UPI001AD844A4|nr:hypothetical protein [Streptomyces armeniacus]